MQQVQSGSRILDPTAAAAVLRETENRKKITSPLFYLLISVQPASLTQSLMERPPGPVSWSVLAVISKIAQTGWLNNNGNSYLTALEAENSQIKLPKDSVSGEGSVPGAQTTTFLLSPHRVQGVKELPGSLLLKHQSHHLPKSLTQVPSHWGLGSQHMNLGDTISLQHSSPGPSKFISFSDGKYIQSIPIALKFLTYSSINTKV